MDNDVAMSPARAASSSSSSSSSSTARARSYAAFLQWYADCKNTESKEEPTLRIFQHKGGEYYTAYGLNAEHIADAYFNTRDILKIRAYGDDKTLAVVNIRPQKLQTILRDAILKKNLFAEIYVKDSNQNEWTVAQKASPGNVAGLEEFLYGSSEIADASVVMAVKLAKGAHGGPLVGVALVNASSRVLELTEFEDNERFTNLQATVAQRGAKECILPKSILSSDDNARVLEVMKEADIPITIEPAAKFAATHIEQDLKRLVGHMQQHFTALEKQHALGALAALIKQTELLRDESGYGNFQLHLFDLSQFMRLDSAALSALHLFPAPTDSDKFMNLYNVLNRGKTAAGHRLLNQWIKQPLLDINKIRERHDLVDIFYNNNDLRSDLLDQHLKGVPDLERLAKKIQKKQGQLDLLVTLYRFCIRLPGLAGAVKEYSGDNADLLKKRFGDKLDGASRDFEQFMAMVEQTVDLKALQKHEYLINPAFNPELGELAERKTELEAEMADVAEDVRHDLGVKASQVHLQHHSTHGYHLRVSRKDEKHIRNKHQYMTLETRKDGVRFTTMRLKKMSREWEEASSTYAALQKDIVNKCLDIAGTYSPVMLTCSQLLAELDVLVGFAQAASLAPIPYVRPTMKPLGAGVLQMTASRHPCMEVQQDVNFIANNVEMDAKESALQVITGPNMGGKSTFIRQVGVIVLMSQIGSFVPCESATITVVDCILARIGAGDSQLRGVSTFMKEMLEASSILRSTTKDSLLIIDELGRGTSTYDGFGLAWAIAEHIARDIGAFTFFATHFHELTALADEVPGVVNKHVTALTDDNSITMLYEVKDGACDRSFGIHVAELAKFPTDVVEMAKRKATELEDFGSKAQSLSAKRLKQNLEQTPGKDKTKLLKTFAELPVKGSEDVQRALEFSQSL